MAQDHYRSLNAPDLPSSGSDNSYKTHENAHQPATSTFSIATPTVTTILPATENLNDTSFMTPSHPYQQVAPTEKTFTEKSLITGTNQYSQEISEKCNPIDAISQCEKITVPLPSDSGLGQQQKSLDRPASNHEDDPKSCKRRNKTTKKSIKLDAKSKLEKSRQSARECRARKKLRYQYLEDLVCNREKAVIKLREELSTVSVRPTRSDVGHKNSPNSNPPHSFASYPRRLMQVR